MGIAEKDAIIAGLLALLKEARPRLNGPRHQSPKELTEAIDEAIRDHEQIGRYVQQHIERVKMQREEESAVYETEVAALVEVAYRYSDNRLGEIRVPRSCIEEPPEIERDVDDDGDWVYRLVSR